jgi:hypothetical protein
MLKRLTVAIVLLVFCFQSFSTGAQAPDEQGVLILERAVAASGGRAAWNGVGGYRASGAFSLYSRGEEMETGTAVLVGMGLKKFHLTATFKDETRSWLWNDGRGYFLSSRSGVDVIGRHNLAVLESMVLPTQKIIALLDAPLRTVQLVESTALGNTPVYRIRVTRKARDVKEAAALGKSSFVSDILVDQQTLAILAIEDTMHANSNTRDAFQHRLTYGNYRDVSGVWIPFSISEEITGQRCWTLQLDSAETNVLVDPSEFTQK